jgi:hypothetical protein
MYPAFSLNLVIVCVDRQFQGRSMNTHAPQLFVERGLENYYGICDNY